MGKSTVFMFSGQGSQYYHMGKELFAHYPVFRKWMLKLNKITQEITGDSIIDQLYDENKRVGEQFDHISYTHPAIFMVEYATAQMLLEDGVEPDFVLGTSLGEFAAAAVAGVMGVEELLESVIRQAHSLEFHSPRGGMLAIIHHFNLFRETPLIHENSELASVNFDSLFVVSGRTEKLKIIQKFLASKGIICQVLPVSYGFHSSLIDPAAIDYLNFLKSKFYQIPQITLVSCLHGKILKELPNEYFWEIVRKPIKFPEAIRELEEKKSQSLIYLDLGPGGTLANFTKRNLNINSHSKVFDIITPFYHDLKNLAKVKENYSPTILAKNNNLKIRKVEKMITYVFPGQGSQFKGMGGTLFDEFPKVTAEADEIMGYSIKELCLKDPGRQMRYTQYTQPALYTVNVLSYLKKVKETGRQPDYVAGHSLGEYSALFAAGVFDFKTGLKLVKKRGELMGPATGGGMAAVLGLKEERVEEILRENGLDTIEIANYNTPTQIVVSGLKDDIERASSLFEMENVMYIPLNVSGAFHSRHMKDAKKRFEVYLNQFTFSEITIPVISNVYARPYREEEVQNNLALQMTHSVKWTESIRYLMGLGEMEFKEIGPGDVLTKLVQRIREQAEPLVLSKDEDGKGQKTEQQLGLNKLETKRQETGSHFEHP